MYPEAAAMYIDLLRSDSTDYWFLTRATESWNLHGLDRQAGADKDGAEKAFEKAVIYAEQTKRHHADSSRTWVNLAAAHGNLALFRGGKEKVKAGQMVEDYANRALEIDSTDVIALSILGVFHREVSKLSWLERTLARAFYGNVPSGSIERSVSYLEKAVEADSSSVFPNYSLAVTYRQMDRDEAALRQLETVLKLPALNSEEARYKAKAMRWLAEAEREGRN
jgi:tetratricopeptide (TPR) repeat protein